MIPAVIPYYKKLGRLLKCKRHLNKQTMPVTIHVVNDNKRHSGYTAAVNRGLRHWLARPQWNYLVVLDQDMYLDRDAVKTMYEFMESHPKCGIAVALQQKTDNPLIVQGGGADCYPVGCVQEAHISYYENPRPLFWGDLACFMIRRECLWDIGVMDENLRFICSDSDYCLTARSKGWEVWIPAGAKGVHQKGQAHPDTYKNMTEEEMKDVPILQQMGRDQTFFKEKWIDSGYYHILKFEKEKPVFIIKDGSIAPASGQDLTVNKKAQAWIEREKQNVVSSGRHEGDGSIQVPAQGSKLS